jgi:hypothetical protein
VQDYFSPYLQCYLNTSNRDLGSGGIAILPDQAGSFPHLAVTADKFQNLYVLNRDNMGQYNGGSPTTCTSVPTGSDNVVQELNGVVGDLFSSPIYFNRKVYLWGINDVLKAFTITNGFLSTSATDSGPDTFKMPGSQPTISANGTSNAILWALRCDVSKTSNEQCTAGPQMSSGVLYAYDANNLSKGAIYNSSQNATDDPGISVKFAVPIVANGKVYVGGSQLTVYGLKSGGGGTAPAITSANNTTFAVGTAGSFTVTTTGTPIPR